MTSRWERKQQHLALVVKEAEARLEDTDASACADYIRAFYAGVSPEDMLHRDPGVLFAQALSMWRFAADREPARAKIRVFNPTLEESGWETHHTSIEIVNDDMPFLVDSITSELGAQGHELHMVAHPIIEVRRDADGHRSDSGELLKESYIYLEIDRESDKAALKEIAARLESILCDVRCTVADWRPMLAQLQSAVEELKAQPGPAADDDHAEAVALLEWLANDRFTFLGYSAYDYQVEDDTIIGTAGQAQSLGLLRQPDQPLLRGWDGVGPASQPAQVVLREPNPLIILKADRQSTVHRRSHMDYIGVKRFNGQGELIGEHRFVGLFTSAVYSMRPHDIPLLRQTVARLVERSGFPRASHDGKALINILEAFPRDELFQVGPEDLYPTVQSILRLEERPRARAFVRRGRYGQFLNALIFIPRENFNTALRQQIESLVSEIYHGEVAAFQTRLGDSPLARLQLLIRTEPGQVPEIDPDELDTKIAALARTWTDHLKDQLVERHGEEQGNELWGCYGEGFRVAYRDAYKPDLAAGDISYLEQLESDEAMAFNVWRRLEDKRGGIRIKIYHASRLVPLSDCVPKIEHLGLHIVEEQAYAVQTADGRQPWVHDFYTEDISGEPLDLAAIKAPVEETLAELWAGQLEDDSLNELVLSAGLDWREVAMLRGYLKYLRQTGITFSQSYMRQSLANNPVIVGKLVDLFAARFDPETHSPEIAQSIQAQIDDCLNAVDSLDEDRIIRRFTNLIQSTLRTNYYQVDTDDRPKPQLSFKLDSKSVEGLPLPRPAVEVFVYSPRVEGVHLRGGAVARGGLRWSDRPEDFRTEILGLMKAQMVKNAVIVPVGAKGGFVPKNLPAGGSREEIQAEGITCYKSFISGLLDITDNIVENETVAPERVVRHDGDDPYLVVAADKGTATFSDIANKMALDHGFWLGDAFASGGSNGYDHKKMGITARGAWISVQRHFRELGTNVQTEPVRVIGIGDMSGDVFGNGMLASKAIKLVAAFDHRDIFIDPDPDPEASHAERQRLFELPRSSWQDYREDLISAGGGIFSRSAKSVEVNGPIKDMLGISDDALPPADLIKAILKSQADLLWIGGIGTYVKAASETHQDVGDRANDALRVDGAELNVKVVGEGGNLGLTQRGRIEFALKGGLINTDAVDNSGGVDCSDHEVNIKILLGDVVDAGDMTLKQRNALLEDMTGDVAELVLDTNYRQTETLSTTCARAPSLLDAQARFMRRLEQEGVLNRDVEFLPGDDEIADRANQDKGLTRPELAVLLAYAKNSLYDRLMRSDVPDDSWINKQLVTYFPQQLQKRFTSQARSHRLHRELAATMVANEIINRAGITYVTRVAEESGATVDQIATAYIIAREVMGLKPIWDQIDALDNKVDAAVQTDMFLEAKELLHRKATWFLTHLEQPLDIAVTIQRFEPGTRALAESPSLRQQANQNGVAKQAAKLMSAEVPEELAWTVANLAPLSSACDILLLAENCDSDLDDVASTYFRVGDLVGFDWLRAAGEDVPTVEHWDRLAVNSIVEDLYDQQRELAAQALVKGSADAWRESHKAALTRVNQLVAELRSSGTLSVSKLGYVARQLRGVFASI
ncbi:MAG: NAD-glutamate dehydrogenase [Alphaproteobacteria bacterium]